jgi:hypothetical protein
MAEKVNINKTFRCNFCNRNYSSLSSLCNHNKKFHSIESEHTSDKLRNTSEDIRKRSDEILITSDMNKPKEYNCRKCNKVFSNVKTRWSHEQKCNIINEQNEITNLIKLEETKLQIIKEEKEILKLKLKLEKSKKLDNVTLNKLNKKLRERSNLIKNSNINSNNTNTNNTININNNFKLIGFGKEEVLNVLTNKEKSLILNSRFGCLEKLIQIVHCGSYNEFKNILITNIKDNFMYKYDDKKEQFVLATKQEIMNSLIDSRMCDLEVIYNDFLTDNKLNDKTKDIIEQFINRMNYIDTKFTDYDGKEHPNYKQYKINEIKILLYNNQDIITNNISLVLSANEITNN